MRKIEMIYTVIDLRLRASYSGTCLSSVREVLGLNKYHIKWTRGLKNSRVFVDGNYIVSRSLLVKDNRGGLKNFGNKRNIYGKSVAK
jgi:hypothetical protein